MTYSHFPAGGRARAMREPLEPRPSGYESDDDEPAGGSSDSAALHATPAMPLPGTPIEGPEASPDPLTRGQSGSAAPARGPAQCGAGAAEGVGLGSGDADEPGPGEAQGGAAAGGAFDGAELSLADLDLLEASGRAGEADGWGTLRFTLNPTLVPRPCP